MELTAQIPDVTVGRAANNTPLTCAVKMHE